MVTGIDNTEIVMSAQLQDLPESRKAGRDVDVEIRNGVLAAVMHVAAASMPSMRELALEFMAANDAIAKGATSTARTSTLIGRALAPGLSVDSMKEMALERRSASELLDVMRRGAQLVRSDVDGKAAMNEYCKVVVDAVEHAARTDIGAAFPTQRPTYAQRAAIDQIRSALAPSIRWRAPRTGVTNFDP